MANRKRPTPKRPAGVRPGSPLPPPVPAAPKRNALPWIIGGGIAVVVAFAAIIAVVASGGGDDDDREAGRGTTVDTTAVIVLPTTAEPDGDTSEDAAPTTAGPPAASAEPGEYQEVTVAGDPLVQLPDRGDPALGLQAPGLRGFGFDGSAVSVTPGDGQPTMLVFLAHWCPHCNREVPRLVEWFEDGDVPADLRVVGVSTGARSDAPNWPPSEWIADENWPWEVLADSQDQVAAASFGLPGYPFFVLIGADGTVLHRQSGEIPISTLQQILATNGIQ